ncbi:MAG TPA: Hsp20/alpha crystallin family protein [Gemmatimonadales bacterium]|nr:Hsp20/alpha crystallin family protein [Gemmatimonadales bacterium]
MFGVSKNQLRDPMLDLLNRLERRMGRIFNEPFLPSDWQFEPVTGAFAPPVDIVEEPEVVKIVAEIPGVKPEDVKISVTGNLLIIQGTKEQVAEEKAEKVHRYERTYGAFERTFTLPATVDPAKIKAVYEGGLLTITLPKLETAKPQLVKIEVSSPKALK